VSSDTSDVRYEVEDAVATVTLHRPEVLNALRVDTQERYFAALHRADDDPRVRAVVVTGAGRGFCAGADLGWLAGVGEHGFRADETHPNGQQDEGQHDTGALGGGAELPDMALDLSIPVIGAINGPAAGLGFAIMLMTDVRFAAAGSKFTTTFARLGLIAEYGTSWLLPRLIGVGNALDLLLTGRTFTAEEGKELGLFQRVLPADEVLPAAQAYARGLAQGSSPTSMALIRRQVYGDLHRSREDAVLDSVAMMLESFERPDLGEGVTAQAQRRRPDFPPYVPPGTTRYRGPSGPARTRTTTTEGTQ
jgi:enoyl-CoA hydratase/carnithine racemase